MAYSKERANAKTITESIENIITVGTTIAANKVSTELGVNITPEQLIIIAGGIKVLISRIRNRIKHRRSERNDRRATKKQG